jgi:hypothetical protein
LTRKFLGNYINYLVVKYIDFISNAGGDQMILSDKFQEFFEELCINLVREIPFVLKFMLKIIFENVLEFYTIEKKNYGPLFTYIFFNFFISPKLQEIYSISPMKYPIVKNLNRLIRNICFNEKFLETDEMAVYNNLINLNHLKLVKSMDHVKE